MIFAIIENDKIINTIVADQSFIDEHYPNAVNIDAVDPMPGIGWDYVGGEFIAPPKVDPEVLPAE
jgi:hypothetical protein